VDERPRRDDDPRVDPGSSPVAGVPAQESGRDVAQMWALRGAAVLLWVAGFGFGVFDLLPIWSLSHGGGVPTVLGFPTYGGGPFETSGIPTTVPLLVAFLVICLGQILAGFLVWRRRRSGALLAMLVLIIGAAFWLGFALPVGQVVGVLWAALIAAGWPALRP
jgi:hypothetical protein